MELFGDIVVCKHVICNIIIADNATVIIPDGFLPFGPMNGDLAVPPSDDGASVEIQLTTDVVIFGTRNNRLYVSLNSIDLM